MIREGLHEAALATSWRSIEQVTPSVWDPYRYLLEVTKQPSTLEYYLSVLYKWLLSSHTVRVRTHTNRKFECENRARKLWCALIRGSNPHAHTRTARGRTLYAHACTYTCTACA